MTDYLDTSSRAPSAMSPSLRVLHVITSVSPVRGGTSTAIWSILAALYEQDVAIDLVSTDDDGPGRHMSVPLGRLSKQQGARVAYFRRQTRFYSVSAPLGRWLWRHIRDYDLVHIHGLFGFPPTIAAQIARVHGVPYVICPHGMLERWGRENRRATIKKHSIRFLEGPILRHAAAVHFTSENEWRQAEELSVPMRSAIFPLALPKSEHQGTYSDQEREGEMLLFLSRIDIKKGLDILLDAVASLVVDRPALRLVIAGDGPLGLISELKLLASRLRIADSVQWVGFVQGEQKAELLSRATALVLPSHSENFGYAVAEAMAAGLPVVVSRAVGISDLVERSGAGLVTDSTIDSLVERLGTLLNDAELRNTMSQAGRDAAKNELSVETFGLRLTELYSSIVERAATTRYGSQRAVELG